MIVDASTLKPGDQITEFAWGDGMLVTILREPVAGTDIFGRPLQRFWARGDEGREGFVSFGEGGVCNRVDCS